jgi:hypothetical protein
MIEMENLPFLSKNEPQSRSEPENDWRPTENAFEPRETYTPQQTQKPATDALEFLKANPMGLILIGIVIGVLIANMRPVVIKAT